MTEDLSTSTPPRARPGGRTARVTEQVLGATVELIAREGVAGVTYDAIARASGTSRATLYRRWPNRDDLLRDALLRFAEASISVPNTGNLRADIVELLMAVSETLNTSAGRAIINAFTIADTDDPIRRLGQDVLRQRLDVLQQRIDAAVKAGELPPVDLDLLNTMLVAPVYLQVMREHRPLARETAGFITDTILAGLARG